jgi:hypothetical protein
MDDATTTSPRRVRWPWIAGGAAALVAGVVVAIGYFGVHTLFFDEVVDEAGPVFDSGVTADGAAAVAVEPTSQPPDNDEPAEVAVEEPDEPAEPVIVTLVSGSFSGVGRYSGAGTAVVLTDGTTQRFLRFEDDFATDNGPDLFVYLGTGSGRYSDPSEYIELGVLRGNIGSQNYEIPAVHPTTGEPIDLELFDHVAVWCKRFDSTFALAPLA